MYGLLWLPWEEYASVNVVSFVVFIVALFKSWPVLDYVCFFCCCVCMFNMFCFWSLFVRVSVSAFFFNCYLFDLFVCLFQCVVSFVIGLFRSCSMCLLCVGVVVCVCDS